MIIGSPAGDSPPTAGLREISARIAVGVVGLVIRQIVNGITVGSTYALAAVGYTMVFGILELVNFLHGSVCMFGAYACLVMMTAVRFGFAAVAGFMVEMYCRTRSGLFACVLRTGSFVESKRAQPAGSLSYGEQRRLEIVRALASSPKLLLDEPAAGMNPQEIVGSMDFIRGMRNDGVTVPLVEHDMKLVMNIHERICVLDHGEKIAESLPREIQQDRKVIEAYLGKGA